MGQAAGVAAATAAKQNRLPKNLPWQQLKPKLEKFNTHRS
jgi:hypothetical protein